MRKKNISYFLMFSILLSCFVTLSGFAEYNTQQKDGIFTYVLEDNFATITNVDDSQKVVVVPDTLGGAPVTVLAGGAFGGSFTIEEVIIPDSVVEIKPMCFSYCTELKKVVLPSKLKSIQNGVFNHCTKLRTVHIPDSVEVIEKEAFYRCDDLWTVTIPHGTQTIEENAFAACPNLSAVVISSSVQQIEENAFEKSEHICIYAKPDSVAQKFAIDSNIRFEELITVSVNETEIIFDQPPVTDTVNFRTLVPMRAVIEALGGKVSWDESTQTTGITLPGYHITIQIGTPFMKVNDNILPLSSQAIHYNNRTLLPIRDIVETVGGTVAWNEETKHITIALSSKLIH